jgi:hypothetical protein
MSSRNRPSRALARASILALGLIVLGLASEVSATPQPETTPALPAPNGPSPLPPATIDNSLAVGGDDIMARKVDTRLGVDVAVNGHGPYRFIVDSGADTSAIGLRVADDLQLPTGDPAILNGMTSRTIVQRVKVNTLTLGPTTVRNLELPALREADLGAQGLIGIDALAHQRLMMDFDKRLIRIEDARTRERYDPRDIVIIAKRKHGQLILTQVEAAGLPLDAVIDTGSEITIGNSALRDKLLRHNRDKFVTVPVTGVTGATVSVELARIDEVQLGPITLRDVPIAFADVPPFKLFGLSNEPALLLGTDILENFRRVSLDFRTRKVRFQLRRCSNEGVIINTQPDDFMQMSSKAFDACGK